MEWKKELLSAALVLVAAFVLGVIFDLIFYHDPLANVENNLMWGVILDIVLFIFDVLRYLIMRHHEKKMSRRR